MAFEFEFANCGKHRIWEQVAETQRTLAPFYISQTHRFKMGPKKTKGDGSGKKSPISKSAHGRSSSPGPSSSKTKNKDLPPSAGYLISCDGKPQHTLMHVLAASSIDYSNSSFVPVSWYIARCSPHKTIHKVFEWAEACWQKVYHWRPWFDASLSQKESTRWNITKGRSLDGRGKWAGLRGASLNDFLSKFSVLQTNSCCMLLLLPQNFFSAVERVGEDLDMS